MAAKQECVKEMDNGIILAGSAPLDAFPHSSPLGLNKRLRFASSCCATLFVIIPYALQTSSQHRI